MVVVSASPPDALRKRRPRPDHLSLFSGHARRNLGNILPGSESKSETLSGWKEPPMFRKAGSLPDWCLRRQRRPGREVLVRRETCRQVRACLRQDRQHRAGAQTVHFRDTHARQLEDQGVGVELRRAVATLGRGLLGLGQRTPLGLVRHRPGRLGVLPVTDMELILVEVPGLEQLFQLEQVGRVPGPFQGLGNLSRLFLQLG